MGSVGGATTIPRATGRENIEIVSLLVKNGADTDCGTSDKWTPLHRTAVNGQAEVMRFLLEQGANPPPSLINKDVLQLRHACRGGKP
jgi:ankyrin repeat protein